MLSRFRRWLNRQKGIFVGSALLLFAAGIAFQNAPGERHWGAPRCDEPPPRIKPVSLEAPPPLPGFLAGARGSPFAQSDRTAARPRGRLPVITPPPPEQPKKARLPAKKIPPPPTQKPAKSHEPLPTAKPRPYDLPVRLAGRVRIEDGASRTVFVVKEDGRYVAVKEGEVLPGLGVTLVRATKSIVVVENEKGQRFRLNDLLRMRSAKDEGLEGQVDEEGEL